MWEVTHSWSRKEVKEKGPPSVRLILDYGEKWRYRDMGAVYGSDLNVKGFSKRPTLRMFSGSCVLTPGLHVCVLTQWKWKVCLNSKIDVFLTSRLPHTDLIFFYFIYFSTRRSNDFCSLYTYMSAIWTTVHIKIRPFNYKATVSLIFNEIFNVHQFTVSSVCKAFTLWTVTFIIVLNIPGSTCWGTNSPRFKDEQKMCWKTKIAKYGNHPPLCIPNIKVHAQ